MRKWRGKHNHLPRRVGEYIINALMIGGLIAKHSYKLGLQGELGVTRYALALPEGKRLSLPLRIAFASDFHAGPTTHPKVFDHLCDEILKEDPDLLLLGGDFVSYDHRYIQVLSTVFACLSPPLGKYAVFGNHDLWVDDTELAAMLSTAGVEILVNRNVALPTPYEGISICGLDDPWTGSADADKTFDDTQAIRLLLMHAPDGLLLLHEHRYDLAFAGHTHGGQITLGNGTPILVPGGPLGRKYCHGLFDIENNGSLIVSRGIGCSTLPIRLNAHPELVICTLY